MPVKRQIFTLIELLLVVAIIAIIVSILLPALNSAKQKAWSATCTGNLKTLALFHQEYADDWGGYSPQPCGGDGSNSFNRYTAWTALLKEKLNINANTSLRIPSVFQCPANPFAKKSRTGNYSYNGTLAWTQLLNNKTTYKLGKVRNTTRIFVFCDASPVFPEGSNPYCRPWIGRSVNNYAGQVHKIGFSNASFLDGHVGMMPGEVVNEYTVRIAASYYEP